MKKDMKNIIQEIIKRHKEYWIDVEYFAELVKPIYKKYCHCNSRSILDGISFDIDEDENLWICIEYSDWSGEWTHETYRVLANDLAHGAEAYIEKKEAERKVAIEARDRAEAEAKITRAKKHEEWERKELARLKKKFKE